MAVYYGATTYYMAPNTLYHHGVKGQKWGVRRDNKLAKIGAKQTKLKAKIDKKQKLLEKQNARLDNAIIKNAGVAARYNMKGNAKLASSYSLMSRATGMSGHQYRSAQKNLARGAKYQSRIDNAQAKVNKTTAQINKYNRKITKLDKKAAKVGQKYLKKMQVILCRLIMAQHLTAFLPKMNLDTMVSRE